MMDVKMINHAYLYELTVKVWQAGELIGSGRIVEHTKDFILLDDGNFYTKASCEIKIAREPRLKYNVLRQFQKAYLQGRVNCKPTTIDERDENWKPLPEE